MTTAVKTEKQTPLYIALFAVIFLVVFNYTLTNMAAIYIVGDLGGSNDISTYTITFFSLGNALGIPLATPFARRFGTVKTLVACLLFFSVFSGLCSQAPNYPSFIIFRFLQGLVSGPFYVLVNDVFTSLPNRKNKTHIIPIMLCIFILGPAIGASWGGWIAYDFEWSWIFYFNQPFILFLAWYLYHKLGKKDFTPIKFSFDGIGYLFYFIGIFGIAFVLTTGQQLDWHRSPLIIFFGVTGIISLVFFILWSLNHPYPILNLSLFKKPEFSYAILNLALLFACYFGMIILFSLWLKLYVDFTPNWIAVLIVTMAIAGLVPAILVSERMGLTDTRLHLGIAIILLAISCFQTTTYNVEINFGRVAISRIIAGFGLAFFLPPIFRLCFRSFPESKTLDIVAILQIVRALGSGIGASLFDIVWQRRSVFFHDRLGGQLTAFSEQTKAYFERAKLVDLEGKFADAKLGDLLDRQSTALGLDDTFYLMAWILVGLFILLCGTFLYKRGNFFPEKSKSTELN